MLKCSDWSWVQISMGIDIDLQKTADNVRSYLNTDLEMLLRRSGTSRSDLKSPGFQPVVSHTVSNSQEEKMMKIFDAQRKIEAIINAISNCFSAPNKPHKQILTMCYLQLLPDWLVSSKLGYGHTRYNELKIEALAEFADRIESSAATYGVNIKDLHYYKEK